MQKRARRGTQGHQEEGHDGKEGHQRGHQERHSDTKKKVAMNIVRRKCWITTYSGRKSVLVLVENINVP